MGCVGGQVKHLAIFQLEVELKKENRVCVAIVIPVCGIFVCLYYIAELNGV